MLGPVETVNVSVDCDGTLARVEAMVGGIAFGRRAPPSDAASSRVISQLLKAWCAGKEKT